MARWVGRVGGGGVRVGGSIRAWIKSVMAVIGMRIRGVLTTGAMAPFLTRSYTALELWKPMSLAAIRGDTRSGAPSGSTTVTLHPPQRRLSPLGDIIAN
jgi:hypothetical protein